MSSLPTGLHQTDNGARLATLTVGSNATVLFAAIRSFMSMAESLGPRAATVAACGGVPDKFMGDAIMAVYGAPLSSGHNPQSAVESARQMFRLLGSLNAVREERGSPRIRLGIGVAAGEVVARTIGSPKRMEYMVIGDSGNLASRLQDLTKPYGVELIVRDVTAAAVADGSARSDRSPSAVPALAHRPRRSQRGVILTHSISPVNSAGEG